MIQKLKKNIMGFAVVALLGGALLASCGSKDKTDPGAPSEIATTEKTYAAPAAGGDVTISVKATEEYIVNIPEADRAWLSVKSKDLTTLVLSINKNGRIISRTSTVSLRLVSHNRYCDVTLTQGESATNPNANITVEEEEGTGFVAAGGLAELHVVADGDFKVEIPVAAKSWLSVKSIVGGVVTLQATANALATIRSTEIALTLLDYPKTCAVPIAQAGKTDGGDGSVYALQSAMKAPVSLIGANFTTYTAINDYMHIYNWDYTENPNAQPNDHPNGIHGEVVNDTYLSEPVFKFTIHASSTILDRDRGQTDVLDRQRNEMKSMASSAYYKMNGNWGEWQMLRWKMKIPAGWRPSSSFTHIHQLKGFDGNDIGNPLITITLRANSNGTNYRVQGIHTARTGSSASLNTLYERPLSDFENQWVQIEEEMHYTADGYYSIKITRLSDGVELVNYKKDSGIDMWRAGTTSVRNKYGIYRSYGGDVPYGTYTTPGNLKDETIYLNDFECYLKDINPSPAPHE